MLNHASLELTKVIPWWAIILTSAAATSLVIVTIHTILAKLKFKWSEDFRNQLALDTYLKTNLSTLEIGTMYERYIGYLFEKEGYDVHYHGAINGYEDLGRDLIIKRGGETWIVQTKCWARQKQIQENLIFQLYGSLEHFKRQTNSTNAKAIFYTTASYSERAKEAAHLLGVDLRKEELDRNYPMIKCNVSYKTKEKIYHLPVDEFYDTIKIRAEKGAFFAKTVKEASSQGFRRAKKYSKAG